MTSYRPSRGTTAVLISFMSFIGLGLAGGILGVAWPSIRDEFGLPLDAVGLLLAVQSGSYIVASFFSGRVTTRLGNRRAMLAGAASMALGLLAMASTPAWALMVGAGVLWGLGSGLLDAGLNNYIASYHSARQMNWLHASFGVGLTLGPLLMREVLRLELSWRLGYTITGSVLAAIGLLYLVTPRTWRDDRQIVTIGGSSKGPGILQTLSLPMMWLSIVLFFVYAGMEIGVGQWAYTLFTEHRGIDPDSAGAWVAVYWAGFTVGRILFGFVTDSIRVVPALRTCMLLSALGALLWWLNLSAVSGFLGLALLGFAQAPLFPLLILGTADRVGAAHAPNAIGFQVSAAGIGMGLLPGVAGLLATSFGLGALGPYFFALTSLVLAVYEITLLGQARRAPAHSVSGAD